MTVTLRIGGTIPVSDRAPPPPDELDERGRALALIDEQPPQDHAVIIDWLTRLCLVLTADIDGAGVSVTLSTDGDAGESVAAVSDPAIREVAGLGFSVGEGPARDALRYGRPVLVPHLGGPMYDEWPGFTSAAVSNGLGAIFCFPLQVGAVRFGVLSVFARQPTELDHRALGRCLTMAELATERLLDGSDTENVGTLEPVLESALGNHSEIYQAQGMVAVALSVSLAQALARMRGQAFQSGRQLLEVAVDIVDGRLRLPDDNPKT